MIIPDNVTVYMNGRAYYAHVCGFYQNNERLSLSIDTSCLKGGVGVEVDRTAPPRREITVRAESGGKSVNITYDPHDPEAVKAAEAWVNALFRDKQPTPTFAPTVKAVRVGDTVKFAAASESVFDEALKQFQREGFCCPFCPEDDLRAAAEPLREYLRKYGDPHTSVTVTQYSATETQDERHVTFDGEKPVGEDERIKKAVQYTLHHPGTLPTAAECEFIRKHPETVKDDEPAEPIKARESLLGYEPLIGSNSDFADKIGYLWEESSSGRGYDLRWRNYPGGDANRVCNLYYDGEEGYYHVKALHEGNAGISPKDCTIRALGIKQAMAEVEQRVKKHLQEAAAYSKTRLDKWKPAS